MADYDEDWHDHINRMEDEAKHSYFREKDAKAYQAKLKAEGKKSHRCYSCQEVLECDDTNLLIDQIKLKISHILEKPDQYAGKDAQALAWLLTGYLDVLHLSSKGYSSFLATELRCADFNSWEENIEALKKEIQEFYLTLSTDSLDK